ncbi:MAG TPA: serine/threonine-protein kinase, partial [Polyangiaceae bacterium]
MSKAADRFPTGTVLAGKLRVVQRLGFGGMGAVYEVEHELTRHRRALKLLHAEMRAVPGVVERFLREASAAGRIGNPHIVETFDAGYLESGEPYIVMELLEGETLASLLETQGVLSIERSCAILEQVADGVAAAHAAGIVHRDLKPENIFLTGSERAFVKLLDFGVSKFDSAATGVQNLTMEGSPIGTPYYMSPEQVRGEKSVDARADIYALGVVLYECLTGKKPFVAETLPHLAVLIHEGRFQPPTELRPGLPASIDAVVARAMASDPGQRYANVREFAAQLGNLRVALGPLALNRTQPAVTQPAPLTGTLTPAPVSRGPEPPRKAKSSALVPLGIGAAVLVAGATLL